MSAPDNNLIREFPKISRLFQTFILDQPEEVWSEQVRLYHDQGESRLEFKGVADELDTLSREPEKCSAFLRDVLGVEQSPSDAYLTICNTYNELVVGKGDNTSTRFRVRNAASWVPDLHADDDAEVINSKQLYSMQLKATVPVLPGKWGTIPIVTYMISFVVLLLSGVLITVLLPFPVISQVGSVLILVSFIGLMVAALLMTRFRDLLLNGEDTDEDDDDEEDREGGSGKKKPGRLRRLFRRASK